MIVKGRCRGNGVQLANYLLNTRDNDRADLLAIYGATSDDPRRALLEMSLTSEITGRTDAGLYHVQISARDHEAADMSHEQKMRAVQIMAEQLGMVGHKWVLAEHEKDGRIHQHLVFERYNHDTRRMWSDDRNFEKHMAAARQMEMEFGHQLTHENKNALDRDVKAHILNLWDKNQDAAEFVQAMNKAGFEVTQGMDKRPFQIVDQYGTVHDLTRQLQGVRQAEVSKHLNGIRSDLRPTAEASQDRRQQYEQIRIEQSENLREISDAQDLAAAMITEVKQRDKPKTERFQGASYSFKVVYPPPLLHPLEKILQSENLQELSDRQELAAAMVAYHRQRQADRENKVQDAQKQAVEHTQPANDNQPQKYFNPVTGQEMTAEQHRKLQEFEERQKKRLQDRAARHRDGLEY